MTSEGPYDIRIFMISGGPCDLRRSVMNAEDLSDSRGLYDLRR